MLKPLDFGRGSGEQHIRSSPSFQVMVPVVNRHNPPDGVSRGFIPLLDPGNPGTDIVMNTQVVPDASRLGRAYR